MLDAKTRLLTPALAVIAAVALSGCEASQDGDRFPAPLPSSMKALYNPLAGQVPWPTDIFFSGTDDLTLNIPAPYVNIPFTTQGTALNTLDGYSTTAPISTSFNQPIRADSISAASVHVVELQLTIDKLPAGVTRKLQFGVDFTAEISPDVDSGGKILRITPLKPLKPSSGPVVAAMDNVGYLVLITDGIQDPLLRSAQADETYASFKDAASCSSFPAGLPQGLCQLTKAHLSIGQAVGVDPASVVVSWTFSTQSTSDVLAVVSQLAQTQAVTVAPTGLTTAQLIPGYPGKADIYKGTIAVPYYLGIPATANDRVVLSKYWTAAGPSPVPGLNPDSRNLTRFNPVPAKTGDVTIPLLVTVPNGTARSGAGCPKPAAGWPVAIFQHGFPRDRTDALLIADGLADGCIIMAAIDLPLHGITNPENPLYDIANERTFNLDLVNNTTRSGGPDGIVDGTGTHYLNLANPLVLRDNSRQASGDIITLAKSISSLDVDGIAGADIDPSRIHLIALSNGGIVGIPAVPFAPQFRTATIADAGGVLSRLVLDSPQQGPPARAFANANGLVVDSTVFNNTFLRDYQTAVDASDPINFIKAAQLTRPMHMTKILGDTNVPNSAFDRLVTAGGFTQLSAAGPTPVSAGTGRFVAVTEGSHGSIIYPVASLPATIELQSQAVQFIASAPGPTGPVVVIDNTSIIQ